VDEVHPQVNKSHGSVCHQTKLKFFFVLEEIRWASSLSLMLVQQALEIEGKIEQEASRASSLLITNKFVNREVLERSRPQRVRCMHTSGVVF
jgi:hypothetical protein